MSLGNRIKMLRTSERLTQEEAATSLGVKRSSYANWEINRNEPGAEELQKIAARFGVSVDYLLSGKPASTAKGGAEKDLAQFMQQAEIYFDGNPVTVEDREKIRRALELVFWDSRTRK